MLRLCSARSDSLTSVPYFRPMNLFSFLFGSWWRTFSVGFSAEKGETESASKVENYTEWGSAKKLFGTKYNNVQNIFRKQQIKLRELIDEI